MKYTLKFSIFICSIYIATQSWADSPKPLTGYFPLDGDLSYQCFNSKISNLLNSEGGRNVKRGNMEGFIGLETLEFYLPKKLGRISYGIELKLEVARHNENITYLRHNLNEVFSVIPSTLLARTETNTKEVDAIYAELDRLRAQLYEMARSCSVQR